MKKSKLSGRPKLSAGDDSIAAQNLIRLYSQSPTDLRKIVALGLAAWEIKEARLKYGEWGLWLVVHAPDLVRLDSITGRPRAGNRLIAHMDLAKAVLARAGFSSIQKYLKEVAKFPNSGICDGGNFLLLRENEVPAEVLPLRRKICALVDGKTQRQLFCPAKPGAEENTRVRRFIPSLGKYGVLTRQEHDLFRGVAEEGRLVDLGRDLGICRNWLNETINVSNLAMMSDELIFKFCDAVEAAAALGRRMLETRKGMGL